MSSLLAKLYRWTGTTWQEVTNLPTTQALNAVHGTSTHDAWAVGNQGTILRWNGVNWMQVTSGVMDRLNAVHAVDTNDVFAVGDGGVMLHFDGNTWEALPRMVEAEFTALVRVEGALLALGQKSSSTPFGTDGAVVALPLR